MRNRLVIIIIVLLLAGLFFSGLLLSSPPVFATRHSSLTMLHPPDPRFGLVETYLDPEAAAEAGAGFTRIILRWDIIQPNGPDDWQPANLPDPIVAAELAAGREVVGVIIGTPAWARDPTNPANAPTQPTAKDVPQMEAWANFTARLARQYHGRIHHWVIWNEPDVWDTTHPGNTWHGTVEDFFRLHKTAYLSIKAVDPTLEVHLPGLTYFWDWQYDREQYLVRLLRLITADPEAVAHNFYCDAVIYHLYYKPRLMLLVLQDVHRILEAHGLGDKPIWINETNAPPTDDPLEPPWAEPLFPVSLAEQSAFIIQAHALALTEGVTRIQVYKLRNSSEHPEDVEPFGLVRGDGSRRPAFAAYQVVTRYFAGFRRAELFQYGEIYVVTLDRGEESTTVLWSIDTVPRRFTLNAIADEALLVSESGLSRTLSAENGTYTVDLPAATCPYGECFIGGAPRLLVERGSPTERPGILPQRMPRRTLFALIFGPLVLLAGAIYIIRRLWIRPRPSSF
jgi:hypothetical protein